MSEIRVHVEFKDGRPAQDEVLLADIPVGQEKTACIQVLAGFNATRGLMTFVDGGLHFVPMDEIKSIDIKVPSIIGAGVGDLSAAVQRARAADAVAGRIKL